ncbi:hypothetical protein BCON_0084g00370 [Botryotinia convoluta]|uniref:Uncharacterized protein n=1 Tax=Botryotinia convoluta TaxID=54673 RepID=A0A4Z1I2T8_9HELO|nr:hypothetical protein BCON_0084g00370 [Botryotinia convoluta]
MGWPKGTVLGLDHGKVFGFAAHVAAYMYSESGSQLASKPEILLTGSLSVFIGLISSQPSWKIFRPKYTIQKNGPAATTILDFCPLTLATVMWTPVSNLKSAGGLGKKRANKSSSQLPSYVLRMESKLFACVSMHWLLSLQTNSTWNLIAYHCSCTFNSPRSRHKSAGEA